MFKKLQKTHTTTTQPTITQPVTTPLTNKSPSTIDKISLMTNKMINNVSSIAQKNKKDAKPQSTLDKIASSTNNVADAISAGVSNGMLKNVGTGIIKSFFK